MSEPLALRLTETAEADLAEIWAYVAAEASETTATRLIDRIMAACEQPRYFPLACPARDHLAPHLRVTFTGNYAVYYRHDDRHLVIVRVLHGARDIDALAGHGGFSDR